MPSQQSVPGHAFGLATSQPPSPPPSRPGKPPPSVVPPPMTHERVELEQVLPPKHETHAAPAEP